MGSHTAQTTGAADADPSAPLPKSKKEKGPARHDRYLERLGAYFDSRPDDVDFMTRRQFHEKEIRILQGLDLDPAIPILISLYSPGKLKDARDPSAMLRSLILMTLLRVGGVTKWVGMTKHDPLLAALAGFEPGDVPGIGTYYDFMRRIIDGPYRGACRCENRTKRSEYNAGSHKRNLKKEKEAKKNDFDPNHSQSEKLAGKLLAESDEPRARNFFRILEDMHIRLGVIPAIREGLLSDSEKLVISGDGSILQTAASSRGKPTCDCRSEGGAFMISGYPI